MTHAAVAKTTRTTLCTSTRFAGIGFALVMTLAILAGIDQLATAPNPDALLARTPASQPA